MSDELKLGLPAFFSDLDRTLLYSNNHIQEHHQSVAGSVAVEQLDGKPLSFMHMESWKSLSRNADREYHFVPTTTRTLRQYRRIVLPDIRIRTAVVLNGAKILVDGLEDYDWSKKIGKSVKELDTHPVRLWEIMKKGLRGDPEVTKVVSADDHFVYVTTKTAKSPHVDAYTSELAKELGYSRSKQGRKTYLMPPNVTKGRAVHEVLDRLGSSVSFASGDSVLDFSMADEVSHFIFPAHGDKTVRSSSFLHTEHLSLDAGEEITGFVESQLGLTA